MIGRVLGTAKHQDEELSRIAKMKDAGVITADQAKSLSNLVFSEGTIFKVLQRMAAMTAGGTAIVTYTSIAAIYASSVLFIDDAARMELVTNKIWALLGGVSPIGYMGIAAFSLYLGGGMLEGFAKKLGYKKA